MSLIRDEEMMQALLEAERENRERILPAVRQRIEELKAEMPEGFQKEARIAYLKEEMVEGIVRVWNLLGQYEEDFKADRVLERVLVFDTYKEEIKRIWRTLGEIRRLNGKDRLRPGSSITDEMIERAREYPFEQLYDFKRNMARCPFHNDKHPSMSLKNNRVTCWSCGRSWDSIAFIMERDGLTFPEAVRRLQ